MKRRLISILVLPTLLVSACGSAPKAPSTERLVEEGYSTAIEYLEAYIPARMKKHDFTGMSVALVDDQRVVWSEGFGFADESVGFLDVLGVSVDPRGLLLAGILIGSLGVLDDVTVTQVSAVFELKRASPAATRRELYERGVRIGRDHISSTVNTLFLAYAGAALPLMLLFSQAGESIGSVATREAVAVEITRALVGSLGLVASVPISTLLAATLATTDDVPLAADESG